MSGRESKLFARGGARVDLSREAESDREIDQQIEWIATIDEAR